MCKIGGVGACRWATRRRFFCFVFYISTLAFIHLGISTLTATSDLTPGIALYVVLRLLVVPGLCTVMDAQGLDESVFIPLAHYYCKPLLKRNPCNRALLVVVDSRPSPVVGTPRKVSSKPAMAQRYVLRWWVGIEANATIKSN